MTVVIFEITLMNMMVFMETENYFDVGVVVCPECGMVLSFDEGQDQTFDEPEQPASMYCDECGYERNV